jgi:hypothetical protein
MRKTGPVPDGVGPDPQYDVFANEFLTHARDGFYNAYYDRPACLPAWNCWATWLDEPSWTSRAVPVCIPSISSRKVPE